MDLLLSILSSPTPWPIFILLVGAGIAQMLGFDVIGLLKLIFSFRQKTQQEVTAHEEEADERNALQPLLSKMDELSMHYNHETTESLGNLRATQLQQCTKLDIMVDILQDIQRNGIRIRN